MCGIAGILVGDRRDLAERVQAAGEMLRHRGPDDLGFLGWDGVGAARTGRAPEVCRESRLALVHRRLSILDLSPAGWQPMSSADARYHLVYNGEIYNYRELRTELERLGHRFASRSDTEVLLEAWRRWGTEGLERLVGMFAFAALDTSRRRLVLARDFFGIKPLYYCRWDGGFAFASEIKALLALTDRPARTDPHRLYDYLRFGLTDHGDRTLFAGIRQLPAAHYLEVPLADEVPPVPRRYWQLDLDRRCDLGPEEASTRLRELFLDSVRIHLRSDVPIGAALSGGIDSSAIVMSMRELKGDALELHSISYVADDPELSEERWVELVAGSARAVLHRTRPAPAELAHDLERLIEVQDEPFGSTSIYAQHRVFRLAQESGIKVMLDGQGADELLGGYRSYLAARATSLLRAGRWLAAARLLRAARALPGVQDRDLLTGIGYLVLPPALHRLARRLSGKELGPAWLNSDWFERQGVELTSPVPRAKRRDALRELLYLTLSCSSLPMLLRFEDRNSMAFSIESRVPFLTPQLAAFVLSLPEHYIVDAGGTSKAVFRRAMRGIVPDAILDRRDKIGFATPEQRWLRELRPWVEGTLASETARSLPFLDLAAARSEWEGILAGRRRFDWHVWRWINTIRWVERFGISVRH